MTARGRLLCLLLLGAAACASPSSDINLAPLYLRATAPGIQRTEAFGGLARFEEAGGYTRWALNPLLWRERRPDGSIQADFALMLGRYENDPERNRTQTRVLPLYLYETERRPDGVQDSDWILLPFFAGGSSSDNEENYFAFFPFGGRLKNFLAWEQIDFALFPLWARTRKLTGTQSTHWLWPFFGYSDGRGEGWHVWPIHGRWQVPGRERSSYWLWPFWSESESDLDKPFPRKSWFLFPLYGRIEQDDYIASTWFWPFLGRAERPSTGYYSWSFWPFLKFEEGGEGFGGEPNLRKVQRVLPFWMHFEDDSTEFSAIIFPLFWKRQDDFGQIEREAHYALPLWWSWTTKRYDKNKGLEGRRLVQIEKVRRLWPFAAWRRVIPADPNDIPIDPKDALRPEDIEGDQFEAPYFGEQIARNLTRPLALWQRREYRPNGPRLERAFLGLYHSLESEGHSRWSMPGIGGQWTEPDGTRHHAYLFGLLRWRSGSKGMDWQAPAFPGPGWPEIHRAPDEDATAEQP
jgi:hypothetical protein